MIPLRRSLLVAAVLVVGCGQVAPDPSVAGGAADIETFGPRFLARGGSRDLAAVGAVLTVIDSPFPSRRGPS